MARGAGGGSALDAPPGTSVSWPGHNNPLPRLLIALQTSQPIVFTSILNHLSISRKCLSSEGTVFVPSLSKTT